MSVEDKYVIDDDELSALNNGSNSILRSVVTFEIDADDDDGSVYRLAQLPSEGILTKITILNDAITAGDDFDLGFYDINSGAVVDADELDDGIDLSSAHGGANADLNGLTAVDVANRGKRIWELLGKTENNKASFYDLALTGNTVGTADGTVTIIIDYIF